MQILLISISLAVRSRVRPARAAAAVSFSVTVHTYSRSNYMIAATEWGCAGSSRTRTDHPHAVPRVSNRMKIMTSLRIL